MAQSSEAPEAVQSSFLLLLDGGYIPPILTILHPARANGWQFLPDLPAIAEHSAPVLVILTNPQMDVASRIDEQARPSDAIAGWVSDAETWLRALRRMRRSVVLCTRSALTARPDATAVLLREKFGVDVPDLAQNEEPTQRPLSLSLALAIALLDTNSRANALAGEIEALCALREPDAPVSEELLDAEYDRMRQSHRSLKYARDRMASLETLKDQATTESAVERRAARNLKTILGSAVLTVGAEADARQHLLDAEYQTTAKLRAELQAARDEISGLRQELDKIYQSRSWAVTKPIRAVRRAFPS